ncbi:MAG TPA: phosphoribosyltransferase family protein [Chitinophagaceae bacterium]|nr:phosphoribosyltransferase family protein [Chitinophagaceae bacterium]HNU12835.1 phosphoribosyltransferase family protein [Chitinophagaceae bacterium]
MITLKEIKDSVLHLLFPHICTGCGSDILHEESVLCMRCIDAMPETNFELHPDNPVEKIFWGRLPLAGATAQFYFTKESLMQHLMHQFKYKGNKELGMQLGKIMGEQIKKSARFEADALVPLPLFAAKEKKRGYNQAAILCEGMAEAMNLPVLDRIISRPQYTETQTKKGRIERWKNMEGKFILSDADAIKNMHLLLVDDVVTTGATLEACGNELLKAENVRLSIATLCIASR